MSLVKYNRLVSLKSASVFAIAAALILKSGTAVSAAEDETETDKCNRISELPAREAISCIEATIKKQTIETESKIASLVSNLGNLLARIEMQTTDASELTTEVTALTAELELLKAVSAEINSTLGELASQIDNLDQGLSAANKVSGEISATLRTNSSNIEALQSRLEQTVERLSGEIKEISELAANDTVLDENRYNELINRISVNEQTEVRWNFTLSGILLLIFASIFLVRRQFQQNSQSLATALKSEITEIQNHHLSAISDLIEMLKQEDESKNDASPVDHSLTIKVAFEIHRMRQRIDNLPEDVKGKRPLLKALERLEDELMDKGYEIVDHTGQSYNPDMNLSADFVLHDSLGSGEQIIARVVTPQINYQGILLEAANVVVHFGEEE